MEKLLFKLFAFDTNLCVNSWTCLLVIVPCFRYQGLLIIQNEQSYCRKFEIAVLKGAVGQYNIIHTLLYESVPPIVWWNVHSLIAKHVYDGLWFSILLRFIQANPKRKI